MTECTMFILSKFKIIYCKSEDESFHIFRLFDSKFLEVTQKKKSFHFNLLFINLIIDHMDLFEISSTRKISSRFRLENIENKYQSFDTNVRKHNYRGKGRFCLGMFLEQKSCLVYNFRVESDLWSLIMLTFDESYQSLPKCLHSISQNFIMAIGKGTI